MSVQLAITPDHRWGFATSDLVAAASQAGFAALGISADCVDTAAASAYAATGLRCHEILALLFSDDETATMATAERLADAAATMGAPFWTV